MRQEKFWLVMTEILMVLALMLPTQAGAESTYKVLHRFKGPDGAFPTASLIFDADGNMYGTTSGGGTAGMGTVFKLTPNADRTWKESVLYNFTGGTDGGTPLAALIFDNAGNLYGTASLGGNSSKTLCQTTCGVVYKVTPGSNDHWTESVLYAFHGPDGGNPYASVIFGAAGNMYGTTRNGGHATCHGFLAYAGCGTVFKLTPHSDGGWSEAVIHKFTGVLKNDGSLPQASLIFDGEGNLFGTTETGGFVDKGVVFKLTPGKSGQWTETRIREFYGEHGRWPLAGLIFDTAGNLYGTTLYDEHARGTVFMLQPGANKWTESVLYAFDFFHLPGDGGLPDAPVIFNAAGNLYGTVSGGNDGNNCSGSCGRVFKLVRGSNGWTETILHKFHRGGGANPNAGLILDGGGNLYGTATYGGNLTDCNNDGCGVVFEITP